MRKFMMKLSFLFSLVVTASLALSSVALATGDAGCGLGSVVFSSNKRLPQLLAVTTNATFGSQTFGITTGTSNCKASGIVLRDREQVFYAESNYDNLKIEMAKGQGESLSAFAQVLGCHASSISSFGKMTQAQYENLFPNAKTTAIEMLENVKKSVKSDAELAKACAQVG